MSKRLLRIIILCIVGVSLLSWMVCYDLSNSEWFDEYVFIRLSQNLPSYSTSGDWIKQISLTVSYADVGDDVYKVIYDAPVYLHMPLAPAIVYPLVKLTNDIHLLRLFTILLSLGSFYLIYLILKKRIGDWALLAIIPVVISNMLLAGAMWFYWDAFMAFFFLLTLYIMETKPNSKWQYVTACCLVLTKMYVGLALLLPLMFKNWRIMFSVLAIVPFYIITVVVTGDWFYIITHYLRQTSFHNLVYNTFVIPYLWQIVKWWNLIPYFIMTLPCIFLIKKYPQYVVFYILAVLYGLGTGFGSYQAAILLYGGALVFPMVVDKYFLKRELQTG